MTMQYDVLSAHVNISSLAVAGRTRIKGVVVTGGASAGYTYLWDSAVAPVSVTYGRSGTTITVTSTAHGLATGDKVGLVLGAGTGGQGTTGNYVVTVTGADTYTVQDINSGSVTAGAAGLQATRWLTSIDLGANEAIALPLPGEGMVAYNGVYTSITNLSGVTFFYG